MIPKIKQGRSLWRTSCQKIRLPKANEAWNRTIKCGSNAVQRLLSKKAPLVEFSEFRNGQKCFSQLSTTLKYHLRTATTLPTLQGLEIYLLYGLKFKAGFLRERRAGITYSTNGVVAALCFRFALNVVLATVKNGVAIGSRSYLREISM